MLELLAAATGVELGKLILEQVLNLGKSALEDYVKDFFKDCIQSGVARANAETLKKPMAEAIGFFIKRFIKELQLNDVPESSIEHHFKATIKRFVQDKAVCPILGKAFETDCKQIDYEQLQQIWTQQYQDNGWQFPAEEFDWRRVAKEYVIEVQGIVKANAELRSLLNTELLEEIARNTAQLSPGFDVAKYRESLQCSYGYLKLYTLDSTDRADQIKLWNLFIEQTVREALPPMRYELPLDLKRQLQEQGQLDELSAEALEHYRREYFQQPSRKVLESVAEAKQAVILGDPGSGKSTLLQYLALEWVEGKTETLPLLIELREYALAQSANFLEFLHRGRGADWQFDQQQLHQHLLEHSTLVMFDGLDEVFDRPTQAAVIDDMIRFAQQYPQAKVLVTSRIIGYNPERFQHAGFRQFTIQPLDATEIHEFIDRWYDLAMGSDADKVRLKQRLKDAIENSKAIANLADNPLLLTMMAILNRRQELPRIRTDLYDRASEVLLYQWDIEHKRLNLPMDAIQLREKREMLRAIAYEMQAGEEGLKGNLIEVDRLTRILTDYLRDQGFSEPREKANQLIQQLRERNFILCYRGADSYGFVHRTFLEYFCAVEIKERFNRRGIKEGISFEELRDKVFGQHWQDETWHETLRLICGMIDPKFVEILAEFLLTQKINKMDYVIENDNFKVLRKEGLTNLLLAANCLTEVKNNSILEKVKTRLIRCLKHVLTPNPYLEYETYKTVFDAIVTHCKEDLQTLSWLKNTAQNGRRLIEFIDEKDYYYTYDWNYIDAQLAAIEIVASRYREQPQTLSWLYGLVEDPAPPIAQAAICTISDYYKDEPETLPWLYDLLNKGDEEQVAVAIGCIAAHYKDKPKTLMFIQEFARQNENEFIRYSAVEAIAKHFNQAPEIIELLCSVALNDLSGSVRYFAIEAISKYCNQVPEMLNFFCNATFDDPFIRGEYLQLNPRKAALEALLTHYPTHPKTIELLHNRAINDPDEQLREWAQQQLEKLEKT